ncbi:MAG: hypothetical protein ACO3RB_09350, partial [Ilumatobacteraceae bacterium]
PQPLPRRYWGLELRTSLTKAGRVPNPLPKWLGMAGRLDGKGYPPVSDADDAGIDRPEPAFADR